MSGSSPRVRGTPWHEWIPDGAVRFIPACAGNTLVVPMSGTVMAVHPRVCGEHPACPVVAIRRPGSSPRVRGTPIGISAAPERMRFIPACAGNTPKHPPPCWAPSVHPRVCGEHTLAARVLASLGGSSPRVRGTLSAIKILITQNRFIPACAGNTFRLASTLSAMAVHPRVCGEHGSNVFRARDDAGSSPRVRGTRRHIGQPRRPRRFIPACAGNTSRPSRTITGFSVHPRVCGEHRGANAGVKFKIGSSPRVRGTLLPPPRCRGV